MVASLSFKSSFISRLFEGGQDKHQDPCMHAFPRLTSEPEDGAEKEASFNVLSYF